MTTERTSPRAGRRRVLPACLALLVAVGCIAWALQQVTVKVATLQIRNSVTGFGGIAAVANKNETLEVLGRQGAWLKVRTAGGQEGFVKEGALTAPTLAPATTFNVPGDARTSGIDATAATKGMEPAALDFGRAKGYSTAGVEKMIQTHQSITPEEFAQFAAEGGINPGR